MTYNSYYCDINLICLKLLFIAVRNSILAILLTAIRILVKYAIIIMVT